MKQDSKFHDRHEMLTDKIYSGELLLPHRYVFVLTNICNLACHFCFQSRDKRADAMTGDQWINLVDQLPEYARVTLTGGEPLAFNDFKRVFTHIAKKHQCNMITNGILLSEKVIDLLLAEPNFKVLSISIDDIGNKNRDVRPEHWDRMVNVLNYFHKRKAELGSQCILDAKTVVLDSNAHDLLDIHKYCIEVLGINTHAFQFLKGSPLQHADTMVDMERMFEETHAQTYENMPVIWDQLEQVRQYSAKTSSQVFVHPKFSDLASPTALIPNDDFNLSDFDPNKYQLCKFPWSSVHVNVDGSLFPCIAVGMGNVKDQTLEQIVQGELFTKFKSVLKERLVQACNRCGWLRLKE